MNKKRSVLCLLCIAAASSFLFASKLVNDNCVNETGKTKILIAMQSGQFKDSVMATVKFALEKDSYCVKVIAIGDLDAEVVENYAAAVIVNTCHYGKIGGSASNFLKKLSPRDKERLLLFTTTGAEGSKVKDAGVDAVSSASKLKNALSAADSVVARTKAILQKRR
jgi:hypothetical protein